MIDMEINFKCGLGAQLIQDTWKKSQVLPNFFDRDHSQQTRDSVIADEHLLAGFLIFQLCG